MKATPLATQISLLAVAFDAHITDVDLFEFWLRRFGMLVTVPSHTNLDPTEQMALTHLYNTCESALPEIRYFRFYGTLEIFSRHLEARTITAEEIQDFLEQHVKP